MKTWSITQRGEMECLELLIIIPVYTRFHLFTSETQRSSEDPVEPVTEEYGL